MNPIQHLDLFHYIPFDHVAFAGVHVHVEDPRRGTAFSFARDEARRAYVYRHESLESFTQVEQVVRLNGAQMWPIFVHLALKARAVMPSPAPEPAPQTQTPAPLPVAAKPSAEDLREQRREVLQRMGKESEMILRELAATLGYDVPGLDGIEDPKAPRANPVPGGVFNNVEGLIDAILEAEGFALPEPALVPISMSVDPEYTEAELMQMPFNELKEMAKTKRGITAASRRGIVDAWLGLVPA